MSRLRLLLVADPRSPGSTGPTTRPTWVCEETDEWTTGAESDVGTTSYGSPSAWGRNGLLSWAVGESRRRGRRRGDGRGRSPPLTSPDVPSVRGVRTGTRAHGNGPVQSGVLSGVTIVPDLLSDGLRPDPPPPRLTPDPTHTVPGT